MVITKEVYDKVIRYSCKITRGSLIEAEEVSQQCFEQLLRYNKEVNHPVSFIYTCVLRTYVNMRIRKRNIARTDMTYQHSRVAYAILTSTIDADKLLTKVMSKATAGEANTLCLLLDSAGDKLSDIAKMNRVNEETFSSRVRYLRKRLTKEGLHEIK